MSAVDHGHWQAELDLGFAYREPRTVLTRNLHRGPLQVQKALYPEGPEICHVAVLHPPGGIASGDSLTCLATLGPASHACLTTPGASKWYRCPEAQSRQHLKFFLGPRARLEWLPRENILFDSSRVRMRLEVDLAPEAIFFGWEILCFGRRASGERWRSGALQLHSSVSRDGVPLWRERAHVQAASGFAAASVGLAGFTVSATLIAAGAHTEPSVLAACRDRRPADARAKYGITALPGVLLARYLGDSSEDAFNWFTSLWKILRPVHLKVAAKAPRLWAC